MKPKAESEIEKARQFIRLVEELTPKQKALLGEYMRALEIGHSTKEIEAKMWGCRNATEL